MRDTTVDRDAARGLTLLLFSKLIANSLKVFITRPSNDIYLIFTTCNKKLRVYVHILSDMSVCKFISRGARRYLPRKVTEPEERNACTVKSKKSCIER